MPTYDYKCAQCSHVFELVHRMSESPKEPCPQCGGLTEKILSPGAGLLFKGSGFYVTDSKSGGGSHSHGAAASSDSGDCGATSPADSCGASHCAMNQTFE